MKEIINQVRKDINGCIKYPKKIINYCIVKAKKLFKILIPILVIIIIITGISSILGRIRMKNKTWHIVNNIYSLIHYSDLKKSEHGEFVQVNNFDLYDDTLPFSNFSSLKSPWGNCEGYSVFEYLNFHKDIRDEQNFSLLYDGVGNLGDIKISEADLNILDNKVVDLKFIEDYKYTASDYNYLVQDKSKMGNFKKIIDFYFGEVVENTYSIEAANLDFENDDYEKIIKDINYLQNNTYVTQLIEFGFYTDEFYGIPYENEGSNISILMDNVDNDKLSVVSFNNNGGHALLVYAYEVLDENNIKIYVKDSNLPLSTNDNLTDEQSKLNKEIEENCYILYTFDFTGDCWSFIYNPNIFGTSLYGEYNSLVPGIEFLYYDFENIY